MRDPSKKLFLTNTPSMIPHSELKLNSWPKEIGNSKKDYGPNTSVTELDSKEK